MSTPSEHAPTERQPVIADPVPPAPSRSSRTSGGGYDPVSRIALVVIAAAHLSAVSRVAFGPLDPEWEKSDLLEPFGGKFPDLTAREWTSVAPLVLLVVLLGVWPAPVIAATTGTVRDLASVVSAP